MIVVHVGLDRGPAPSPACRAIACAGLECQQAIMLGIDARAARYTWTAALVLLLLWLVYLMRTTVFVLSLIHI